MNSSKQNTDLPGLPGRGDLLVPNQKARLREQLREVCRFKHLSGRTEEAYKGVTIDNHLDAAGHWEIEHATGGARGDPF